MSESLSRIEDAAIRRRSVEDRLKAYPELKAKVEMLLDVVENAGGDVEKADEAERRVIEEIRQMGNEVLHAWARSQEQKKEEAFGNKSGVNRKVKKTFTGTPGSEKSRSRNRSSRTGWEGR